MVITIVTTGGFATSWWLQQNLLSIVKENWSAARPEASITDAFLKADSKLLAPQGGFLGMGERGVGGSKCGASAAVALIYNVRVFNVWMDVLMQWLTAQDTTGATKLLTANVGDSRVLLVRDGEVLQLTEDHVPDKYVMGVCSMLGAQCVLVYATQHHSSINSPRPSTHNFHTNLHTQ